MNSERKSDVVDPYADLQDVLDRLIGSRDPFVVLEAGCGSATHVKLPNNSHIVGIDISPEQLEKNTLLDDKILGDIQRHEFKKDSFDLIVCWDVLEHLPNPNRALESFVRAVKPNGLIMLAMPNMYSLKGLITKFSPHWFHVWVYRNIFGNANAGEPGFAPFRTFLRPAIAPTTLKAFLINRGLVEDHMYLYESSMISSLKNRSKLLYFGYKAVLALTRILSLGLYDGSKTDYFIICRKMPI